MTPSLPTRVARAVVAAVLLAAALPQPAGAKAAVVAQFSGSQPSVRFAQLYRLRYLGAKSVADVLRRSFAHISVSVVADVNGVSVTASAAEHARIADALAQLDVPGAQTGSPAVASPASPAETRSVASTTSTAVDVVTLHAAIPGVNGAPSTSASDIATAVLQALSPSLPDLRMTVYANQSQLLLTGSPATIRVARQLIDKLDALPKMVVLDVTIVEVDENVSKNLGLSLNPAVVSTTYTETTPATPINGGAAPPLLGLQQFARTPLSIGFQLNLLIQNGKAKVIADPKLTTLSGRTASIRAGDNIAILTTTGGSVGTVATTQLQTFNTGVQLDITPVINAENFVSVTLHPTVNNLASIANGVPQISTRDAQTTVALREGQTLIIGGLIEDSYNRTDQRIPVLGYLPLIGPLFTSSSVTGSRNELIITVTPHIIDPLTVPPPVGPAMTQLPAPFPLPTLAPSTVLPPMRYAAPRESPSSSLIALPSGGADAPQTATNAPNLPAATPAPSAAGGFVYGQRPPSIPAAGPHDPPRILFVSASPQLVRQGTTIMIEAVTTPNISRVLVQLGGASISLHQAGPGLWEATVPFSTPSTSQMTPLAVLSALRADGVAATLNIPLTVLP